MNRAVFVFFLLSIVGCEFLKPKEVVEEPPLARVNEQLLYPSDLQGLIRTNTSSADSIQFAERFVNDWVEKQLMIARSSQEVDLNQAEIERKVLEYRFALTRSAFEKKYIQENLNEDVREEEILEYYESHSEDFILKQNIVRCLFAQIPEGAPRQKRFEKDIQDYPESNIEDLREYCTQFANRAFVEDSVWVDFNEIILATPFEKILDKNRILRTRKYLTDSDEDFGYFLKILEYKMVDDTSPIEFVREDITNIIINKRKIALKRELEEKVYEEAQQNNAFEIYSR
jgi:hypothetical protein